MDRVTGFDWDAGNREKCQKHGVSIAEIEHAMLGPMAVEFDPAHSIIEPRQRAVGRTAAGRHLFIVFTVRQRTEGVLIRPISARYMHAKEVRHYEEIKD